jgi:hypothetical protein
VIGASWVVRGVRTYPGRRDEPDGGRTYLNRTWARSRSPSGFHVRPSRFGRRSDGHLRPLPLSLEGSEGGRTRNDVPARGGTRSSNRTRATGFSPTEIEATTFASTTSHDLLDDREDDLDDQADEEQNRENDECSRQPDELSRLLRRRVAVPGDRLVEDDPSRRCRTTP